MIVVLKIDTLKNQLWHLIMSRLQHVDGEHLYTFQTCFNWKVKHGWQAGSNKKQWHRVRFAFQQTWLSDVVTERKIAQWETSLFVTILNKYNSIRVLWFRKSWSALFRDMVWNHLWCNTPDVCVCVCVCVCSLTDWYAYGNNPVWKVLSMPTSSEHMPAN